MPLDPVPPDPVPRPVRVVADDGTPLAALLFVPEGDGPFATLVEALPYRMHDITASYAATYHRLVAEGGFAVLRVDVRGTGSSGGRATDEYPDEERSDLRAVFRWIAAQPWSTGRVGMFGTSYSGFNSLHMAMEDTPELGAVAAMYATDDRYTDDVHYMGGVLRALDLIDYPLYMIAMNALPPVPAMWAQVGDGDWRGEWRRRIEEHEPWLLEWLGHPLPDPVWRRGSVRTGPAGEGYERYSCPVLLIAGWADGYRNNTFRAIEHMDDWYLLAGPWSHKDPDTARPGPNIDLDVELIRFFDEHLRGGPKAFPTRARVFVRRPTPPAPDLALHDGRWVGFDEWPLPEGSQVDVYFRAGGAHHVRGDVGLMAWNSCAGSLPWGQPLDQRRDNADSLCLDAPVDDEHEMAGNPVARMRVRSSAPCGHVSVKLCDVASDGTSTLVTRGMLDLAHRGVWPSDGQGAPDAPLALVPAGEWLDVAIELEGTTWTWLPGHTVRLAIAGTDWPNCWPAPGAYTLEVAEVVLSMPVLPPLPDAGAEFAPGSGPSADDREGVEWRHEHDVLRRETWVHTRYGGPYHGADGLQVTDHYEGHVGISTADPSVGWARGTARFELALPGAGVATTEAVLDVSSDADSFHVAITLTATHDGEPFGERRWQRTFPRR